ncbi:TolC family protein [Reichenbachiella sp. MSK19-1]|uniref:TolC family protein n=1 Tax=Reichenbachiella sp. MSK19-1 TaxID=1897631 RepID=UPI000E6D381E|nr:TolC family protein [Reichenbachiella sp. MSK19-1]RJE71643.1 hypothetical protein BGP76_06020 [Reichenbachiella sp. MSK19-1]
MKINIATFIMLLTPLLSHAQKVYTLDECVSLALEQNLEIGNSRYDQLLYDEQVKEVKRAALPKLGFGAEYDLYTQLPTTVIPSSAFSPGAEGYAAASFGTPHQSTYALQLEQVIFNPSLNVGIKAAQTINEMGEIQYVQTKENITFRVASTYYNAQVVAKQIEMLEDNSQSLDTLIASTRMMMQSGLVNTTDVDRLVINKSSLDNHTATLQADYIYLINSLKLLLNMDTDEGLTIEHQLSPDLSALSFQDAFQYENRSEVQLLNKQKEVLDLQEKQINSGYLPHLSAVASYGVMGYGDQSENYYEHYDFSYVGLKLNWMLFDGMVKSSQKTQKKIEMKQLNAQLEMTQRSIENERINALSKLKVHQREVANQKQSMELATNIYQNIQMQYSEGVVGVQEIIESENELTEAQTNYLNSWVRLQQAKLDLAKAEGHLLTHYN